MLDSDYSTVSVAICTYNRVGSLGAALRSIRRQQRAASQIVVVNGPSTDGTDAVLAGETDLTIATVKGTNLSAARNVAIRCATGALVAFIDDDAVADPHWLASIVPAFADPTLGATGGPVLRANGVDLQAGSSAVNCFGDVVISSAAIPGIGRPGGWWTPYPTGTNAVFRREALVQVGGFDEVFDYFHDETDVCRRLVDAGWGVSTLPVGMVHHGMLPGVVRPVVGAPDRRPLVRSSTYFALRHGLSRRGRDETERSIGAYLAAQIEVAVGERPGETTQARAELEAARRSAEDAFAAPPRTRPASYFRMVERLEPSAASASTGVRGKHIVLVCRGFDVAPNNGIAQSYRLLGRAFVVAGHLVRVVAAAPTARADVELDRELVVHHVPVSETASPWQWCADVADAVDAIAQRWPVDLVIGPNWDSEALGVARTGQIGVVTTLHTSLRVIADMDPRIDVETSEIRDRLELDRELMRRSSGFLAATEAAIGQSSDQAGAFLGEGRSCPVIPRGFPDTPIRRQGGPPDPPVVVVVGRCEPRKGVGSLARAWDQVRCAVPGAELQIIGYGWEMLGGWDPVTAGLVSDLVVGGSVRILGPVSTIAVLERLAGASVVAVPSLYESFGLVAAEALRAGVPVVASNVGGLPAVIGDDGRAGSLVPVDDPDALALALVELLTDHDRNERMGRAARQRFEERFTEDRMTALLATAVERWTEQRL